MADTVRIGILGDFNSEFRSHHATNDALQHAAAKLNLKVESEWLPTPKLAEPGAAKILESTTLADIVNEPESQGGNKKRNRKKSESGVLPMLVHGNKGMHEN